MVPFLDLKQQYLGIREEILEAVTRTLDSGAFILGPEVAAFEEEFKAFTGTEHVVGTSSGTTALQLALLSMGIQPGDEVITVPHTFVATVAAILYVGAVPVLVDIDPETYTLDPATVRSAITPKTKCIMPVHLYGQVAEMDPILAIAEEFGLVVLEDAAQAHAATYKGRKAGSLGTSAGFSFYPGKNLGACGEGGAIATNDPEVARKARMLRDWGQEKKYHHEVVGFNARLEAVQAAVLRVKLGYLAGWTANRRAVAARYAAELTDLKHVVLPKVAEHGEHSFHIYPVLVKDRPGFMSFLQEHGVGSGIHYPFAVHQLNGYKHLGYTDGDFPVSERVAAQCVSLPMFPEMTSEMIDKVITAVRAYDESQG
ncbi:MAG: DegT/DnrJ/EryC1/StrS family aminotransferase [Armatimonadota bacterium]